MNILDKRCKKATEIISKSINSNEGRVRDGRREKGLF
jgi:hypothetical protein